MIKRMMMALCIFVCTFTLVACSGQQTNEPLTLGVNAIITEIDKENKIITTKDSEEKGVLGNDCLIDCSKIPMIYCNYDTQDVVDITLDDLLVGDEIILAIRSSEIENLQKEDDNKAKIAVEQLQLGTQRIKKFPVCYSTHIGSTCPELLQLNTRRPHSGTPSRKSEKGLLLFSAQNEVVKRHPIRQLPKGVTRNALPTQRNHDCAAKSAAVCGCRRCLPER